MRSYEHALARISREHRTWLVTGCAGFIGSNLLEKLLLLGQNVIGLDNFSTGSQDNLDQVRKIVGNENWANFEFIEGDIRNIETCRKVCISADIVLHQAALGSVPRSIDDPIGSHDNNVNGFLNMLIAARDAGVGRFVYASSSSVYGDDLHLPKIEARIGQLLSPYATTKYIDELYAQVFAKVYGLNTIGLRYFNVFGPRQKTDGAYAAVIPTWIGSLLRHEPVFINGDGQTGRDFCFVENAIQANLLAATVEDPAALDQVYNVALNAQMTLNELFETVRGLVGQRLPECLNQVPVYRDFRIGDMRLSLADIGKARRLLGYHPLWPVRQGLKKTVEWYATKLLGKNRKQVPSIVNHRTSLH